MKEKYQVDYPNAHYLRNGATLNLTNQKVQLNRLPTLGEILANKTKSPVSLSDFYTYMKEVEENVDYIDFWFDLVNHLNLCKHYVKGLRNSLRKSMHLDNRTSLPLRGSKSKSVSSSILLDLILDDDVLQDNDSARLSQFLRGDLEVNPRLSELIHQYEDTIPSPNISATRGDGNRQMSPSNARVSSQVQLLDDDSLGDNLLEGDAQHYLPQPKYISLEQVPKRRVSPVNPTSVEKLIRNSVFSSESSSFVHRDTLKESSQNMLLKYFVEDSERNLDLPEKICVAIRKDIEVEGRDDPDVFNSVKSFVYNKLETTFLILFLDMVAIRNINRRNKSVLMASMRIILGFFFLFGALWMAFVFVFLNFEKSDRLYIIIPFFLAFYCLVSSLYLIDPILVFLGYSKSITEDRFLIKIEEPFIHSLLMKRSIWVSLLIILLTACFVVLFALVPGHRL